MAAIENNASFVSAIREFLFPRHDERVEAELGRSYRVAFCALAGIIGIHVVLNMFLVMWERQFVEPGGPMPVSGGTVSWVEYFALIATLVMMSIIQIRKGTYITGRWRTADGSFPIVYACTTAALAGLFAGASAMLTRVYVEVHYVGWAHVTWAGDAAIMAIFGIIIFCVEMLALYGSYKAAQKREAKLLEALDFDN